MSRAALVEADDRWVLPLSGRSVERICFDLAVTLMFGGGLKFRIEQPFVLEAADGSEALLVPEGAGECLAQVMMRLARREIARADAFQGRHLEIVFTDAGKLGVPANEGFEAWELVGPDGL